MLNEKDNRFAERWARKLLAWQLLGGKCIVCSNDDFIVGGFHHNQDNKEINPSRLKDCKWETYWAEISKCICMCLNCHGEHHTQINSKQQKEKNTLLNIIGKVSCEKCGYQGGKNTGSLCFHHVKDKSFHISKYYCKSLVNLQEELEKCELLCSNCHYIKHVNFERLNQLLPIIKDKSKKLQNRIIFTPINPEEVFKLHKSSYSISEIAKKLNASTGTIYVILNKNSINPNDEDLKILNLFNSGISKRNIAKNLDISLSKVRYIIKTRKING